MKLTSVIGGGVIGAVLVVACGGSTPPAENPSPASSATPAAASAVADAKPAATTPAATGTAAATTATPAPATSAELSTALRPKQTSSGGGYSVGTVTSTGITQDDVIKTLQDASSKTDVCYAALFKKRLGTTGKTSFDVEIDKSGKTKSVATAAEEVKDADLEKCLIGVLKKITWPKPNGKDNAKTTVAWVVAGD